MMLASRGSPEEGPFLLFLVDLMENRHPVVLEPEIRVVEGVGVRPGVGSMGVVGGRELVGIFVPILVQKVGHRPVDANGNG
jgi:hypothetical protein